MTWYKENKGYNLVFPSNKKAEIAQTTSEFILYKSNPVSGGKTCLSNSETGLNEALGRAELLSVRLP